jgi:hypothetical protein
LKKLFKRGLATIGLIGALTISAIPTFADSTYNIVGTTAITPGELSLVVDQASIVFPETQLSGYSQDITANLNPLTIIDSRGTGEGFRLLVSATPFTSGGYVLPSNTLSLVSQPTITSDESNVEGIQSYTAGAIDNGAKTIIEAPPGAGLGHFSVAFSDNVLKQHVYSDFKYIDENSSDGKMTYSSTLTYSIVSE